MMFFFHIFKDPEINYLTHEYHPLFYYKGTPFEQIIAPLGQMCVSIFAFNSGYAINKLHYKFSSYTDVSKRLFSFLLSYWLVCILFIIYGLCLGINLPDIPEFSANLFGYGVSAAADYINVCHAWYVRYYICLLLISPLLSRLFLKTTFIVDLLIFILSIGIIYKIPVDIANTIWPINASISGILSSKYNIIGTIRGFWLKRPVFLCYISNLSIILFVIFCRHEFSGLNPWWRFDGIFCTLFISAILCILYHINNHVHKVLAFIGSLSMYLWYLHSIYMIDHNHWEGILYAPYFPPIILIWGMLLMLIPAKFCKSINGQILKYISRIYDKK